MVVCDQLQFYILLTSSSALNIARVSILFNGHCQALERSTDNDRSSFERYWKSSNFFQSQLWRTIIATGFACFSFFVFCFCLMFKTWHHLLNRHRSWLAFLIYLSHLIKFLWSTQKCRFHTQSHIHSLQERLVKRSTGTRTRCSKQSNGFIGSLFSQKNRFLALAFSFDSIKEKTNLDQFWQNLHRETELNRKKIKVWALVCDNFYVNKEEKRRR